MIKVAKIEALNQLSDAGLSIIAKINVARYIATNNTTPIKARIRFMSFSVSKGISSYQINFITVYEVTQQGDNEGNLTKV